MKTEVTNWWLSSRLPVASTIFGFTHNFPFSIPSNHISVTGSLETEMQTWHGIAGLHPAVPPAEKVLWLGKCPCLTYRIVHLRAISDIDRHYFGLLPLFRWKAVSLKKKRREENQSQGIFAPLDTTFLLYIENSTSNQHYIIT